MGHIAFTQTYKTWIELFKSSHFTAHFEGPERKLIKSDKEKFNARLFSRSRSHEFIISTFKAKLEWKIFLSPWYSQAANENSKNQLFFLLCFHPNSNSLSRLAHWFQTRHSIAVCFAKVTRHDTEGERQNIYLCQCEI